MPRGFELDVMSFGGSLRDVAARAGQAERLGFDGMWVAEGSQPGFSLATAAALGSSSITVGTGIAVAFVRSPMVSAQAAWALADATGGQFILGLGTQVRAHVERRYGATFDHPGPRLREYVAAIRAIYRAFRGEEKLAFAGDFYSFSLLPREWSPGPLEHPDPPIYLAGVQPWMCQMIGEVADGMHVHPLHGIRYLDDVVLPALRERNVIAVCPVMTATDEAEREDLRSRLAFYGSTPGYGAVFEAHGWPDLNAQLHSLMRTGDYAGMAAAMTDEIVDALSVCAPWESLADALVERYAGRAGRVVCYSATQQWASQPETAEKWAAVAARVHELTE